MGNGPMSRQRGKEGGKQEAVSSPSSPACVGPRSLTVTPTAPRALARLPGPAPTVAQEPRASDANNESHFLFPKQTPQLPVGGRRGSLVILSLF